MLDRYDTSPDLHPAQRDRHPKPWLMVYFRCCHSYGRLHRNRAGSQYTGCCPKCGSRVSARIGTGGTARRMFEAG